MLTRGLSSILIDTFPLLDEAIGMPGCGSPLVIERTALASEWSDLKVEPEQMKNW